ncbi:lipopolysaccharide biosynthesis protein [Acinetobacter qingfengensis]|uniref:Lipopolysaccharide biosynthesis protein n=1 Tax=Acinetobacter qingfengensis TaxID=1262585 RepID=A0A1E7R391_9GAMM|nr:lipopolysaccharide biosynthesis protein [Acinetobacter qingfengensis]KAA8733189.1 lipopolysaccharide biosynthesis protein [Acinetobacter qingfengensis]OEY93839.1 lipopolysaccharide biosynthesis protein [Acinetobacter qingfengensis]
MSPSTRIHPLKRDFFKFIYKFSHPKSYKHNRRYWPYYRVIRNSKQQIEKIYFNNILVCENHLIQNLDISNNIMLVATGPSIAQLNADIFIQENLDYLGVNGAISLENINFKYYVIIDHNFIANRFDLVEKVLKTDGIFFTTPRCLDSILRKIEFTNIQRKIQVIETVTHDHIDVFMQERRSVNRQHPSYTFINQLGFSKNIYDGVFDYLTVAYTALQIIYTLNYSTIYLAGIDMNNFSQPRFYENQDNQQPTLLNIHTGTILQAFDVANTCFEKQHIRVFNLSLTSAIESFPKITFNPSIVWDKNQVVTG